MLLNRCWKNGLPASTGRCVIFMTITGSRVARLIHSKYTADLVYFIMKPLEWNLPVCAVPDGRASREPHAVQYTGKTAAQVEK